MATDDPLNLIYLLFVAAFLRQSRVTVTVKMKKRSLKKMRPHCGSLSGKRFNQKIGRQVAGRSLASHYYIGKDASNEKIREVGSMVCWKRIWLTIQYASRSLQTRKNVILKIKPLFWEGTCIEVKSATTDQNLAGALHQLSLSICTNCMLEFLRLSESLLFKPRIFFILTVVKRFEDEFLRRPTVNDTKTIIHWHTMLVSLVHLGLSTTLGGSCTVLLWENRQGLSENQVVQSTD